MSRWVATINIVKWKLQTTMWPDNMVTVFTLFTYLKMGSGAQLFSIVPEDCSGTKNG